VSGRGEKVLSMCKPSEEKAYCLKVPKQLGQEAIRLVTRLGLLRKDLKVRSNNAHLFVPLNRKPTPTNRGELNEALQQYDISVQGFYRHIKVRRTAFEIAGDRLPPHLPASFPRGIDYVGDIAIVEVSPELKEDKKIIGQAILEADGHVRTVLAKSGVIVGVRRLREYEVIAGSANTETVHKENGCRYLLDVRKVYFSPRLSYEHSRVASQVEENETVIDMFAGVGPFSVLIAKAHRYVKVYAVDVNPDAVRYLQRNIAANGVLGKVIPMFGDVRDLVQRRLRGVADRVIMNLPEKASEYLEAACEALKPQGGVVHYYEFAEGPDLLNSVKTRLVEALKLTDREVVEFLSARIVREVAPFRWQVAVDVKIS